MSDCERLYVSHLTLHDFRSYAAADVALEPGVTAFIGRNGQGKTNLVEAIDYLSRLASHRVATDAPLVRAGADQAVVRAAVVQDGRTAVLEVEVNPGRANRARVNRSPLPRVRDLVGLVRTVRLLPRGPHPGQGRPVGPPPVPRRPAGAAHPAAGRRPRRLRPGAQAAKHPAQDRRRRSPRIEQRGGGALDPRRLGRAPRPGRRRAARRPAGLVDGCGRTSARPTRPSPAARRARTPGSSTDPRSSCPGPDRRGPRRARCSPRSSGAATTSSTAASPWWVRTATTCC